MIVYVESNFVLEVALDQEQSLSAKTILALADENKIELAFPGFALSESFATIMNRGRKRIDLYNSLEETLNEIKRTESMKQIALDMQDLVGSLRNIQRRDFDPCDKDKIESRRRISAELKTYGCQYFSGFDKGLNYIRRFA